MTPQTAVDVVQQALMASFWISLPLLMVGLIAGVVVSLIQIVASLQDPAFGAVPRLAAFLVGLILFLPWMLMRLMSYSASLFGDFTKYAR